MDVLGGDYNDSDGGEEQVVQVQEQSRKRPREEAQVATVLEPAVRESLEEPVRETFEEVIKSQSPLYESNEWRLPVESLSFPAGVTHVTCLHLPIRGNQIVTGDFTGNIKVFSFHSMDLQGTKFLNFPVNYNRPIECLRFSNTGKEIFISEGEKNGHVFDAIQFTHKMDTHKGDIYVRDAAQTLGHTHQIYDAQWHPDEINIFATSSLDGTVRLWDLTTKLHGLDNALVNQMVLKTVNRRGSSISQDCPVYSIAFLTDKEMLGGCGDGSIQLWDARISLVKTRKPLKILRDFGENESIKRVGASYNKGFFHARTENWLFLFDRSKLNEGPLVRMALPSSDPTRPCLDYMDFGRILVTTSVLTDEASDTKVPCVKFFYADNLKEIETTPIVSEGGKKPLRLTAITYSESLKQLYVGTSTGQVICLYHPDVSTGGICLVPKSQPAVKVTPSHKLEGVYRDDSQITYSWYELPSNVKQLKDGSIREVCPRRYQLRAERNPLMPPPGADEPILKKTMAETVMKTFLKQESEQRGEHEVDWVEKVRKGESLGSKLYGDVSIVNKAYRRTQPEPVLDTSIPTDTGEALLIGERKCPQCGLKMCTCGYMDLILGRREMANALRKKKWKSEH